MSILYRVVREILQVTFEFKSYFLRKYKGLKPSKGSDLSVHVDMWFLKIVKFDGMM